MVKTGELFTQTEGEGKKLKKFGVIEGGLAKPAGAEPPITDWLTKMTDNTVFLACKQGRLEVIMTKFTVLSHTEKCVELREGEDGPSFLVLPGAFCTTMKLVEVLGVG